jgi:hypothetical protein
LSGFEQIAEDLFVSSDLSADEHEGLQRRLRDARTRVSDLFGEYSASPTVIVAANAESADRYSSNLHATFHAGPFGGYVVLGPEGLPSLDVLAHELVHAEHFHRVGYLNWMATPAWFIEGLGMQVDARPQYSAEALARASASGGDVSHVRELISFQQFGLGDLTVNNAAAKSEVFEVWAGFGPAGLTSFLGRQRLWQSFDEQLANELDSRSQSSGGSR